MGRADGQPAPIGIVTKQQGLFVSGKRVCGLPGAELQISDHAQGKPRILPFVILARRRDSFQGGHEYCDQGLCAPDLVEIQQ